MRKDAPVTQDVAEDWTQFTDGIKPEMKTRFKSLIAELGSLRAKDAPASDDEIEKLDGLLEEMTKDFESMLGGGLELHRCDKSKLKDVLGPDSDSFVSSWLWISTHKLKPKASWRTVVGIGQDLVFAAFTCWFTQSTREKIELFRAFAGQLDLDERRTDWTAVRNKLRQLDMCLRKTTGCESLGISLSSTFATDRGMPYTQFLLGDDAHWELFKSVIEHSKEGGGNYTFIMEIPLSLPDRPFSPAISDRMDGLARCPLGSPEASERLKADGFKGVPLKNLTDDRMKELNRMQLGGLALNGEGGLKLYTEGSVKLYTEGSDLSDDASWNAQAESDAVRDAMRTRETESEELFNGTDLLTPIALVFKGFQDIFGDFSWEPEEEPPLKPIDKPGDFVTAIHRELLGRLDKEAKNLIEEPTDASFTFTSRNFGTDVPGTCSVEATPDWCFRVIVELPYLDKQAREKKLKARTRGGTDLQNALKLWGKQVEDFETKNCFATPGAYPYTPDDDQAKIHWDFGEEDTNTSKWSKHPCEAIATLLACWIEPVPKTLRDRSFSPITQDHSSLVMISFNSADKDFQEQAVNCLELKPSLDIGAGDIFRYTDQGLGTDADIAAMSLEKVYRTKLFVPIISHDYVDGKYCALEFWYWASSPQCKNMPISAIWLMEPINGREELIDALSKKIFEGIDGGWGNFNNLYKRFWAGGKPRKLTEDVIKKKLDAKLTDKVLDEWDNWVKPSAGSELDKLRLETLAAAIETILNKRDRGASS